MSKKNTNDQEIVIPTAEETPSFEDIKKVLGSDSEEYTPEEQLALNTFLNHHVNANADAILDQVGGEEVRDTLCGALSQAGGIPSFFGGGQVAWYAFALGVALASNGEIKLGAK